MKTMMTRQKKCWIGILCGGLLIFVTFGPSPSLADPALRYQRASGRVERRDERSGGRIENRQERSGGRIERRDERITNRIERRDMLFSPPAGATSVNVEGVQCYRSGGVTYKPAFYEGQTVYVAVNVE